MKILYLGPFERNDSLGYLSSIVLENICSTDHEIYAHSVRSAYDNNFVSKIGFKKLKELDQMPDIIIQHGTLDMLAVNQNTKNYFVPIHPQVLGINSMYKKKLENIDHIFVFDDFEFKRYVDTGIDESKVSKINLDIKEQIPGEITDTRLYNGYMKYYFIGEYDHDKAIIQSIILDFLSSVDTMENACLIVCCESTRDQQRELSSYYENLKNELGLNDCEDKVLFVLGNVNNQTVVSLHKTADVFLSLNDSYYSGTNASLARSNSNIVIGYSDFTLDVIHHRSNKKFSILHKSFRDLLTQINNRQFKQEQNEFKHIQDILC